MHHVDGVAWQMQSRSQITEAIQNANFQVAELKLKSSLFDFFTFLLVLCLPFLFPASNFTFNESSQTRSKRFRTVRNETDGYLLSASVVGTKIRCGLFITLPESFLIYKLVSVFIYLMQLWRNRLCINSEIRQTGNKGKGSKSQRKFSYLHKLCILSNK